MGNLIKSINIFLAVYGLSLNCDPKENQDFNCIGIVDRDGNCVGAIHKTKGDTFVINVLSSELGSLKSSIELRENSGVKTYCFDSVLSKKTCLFDEIAQKMKVTIPENSVERPILESEIDYYKLEIEYKDGTPKTNRNNVFHFFGISESHSHNIGANSHILRLGECAESTKCPLSLWIDKKQGDGLQLGIDGVGMCKQVKIKYYLYNDPLFLIGESKFTSMFRILPFKTDIETLYEDSEKYLGDINKWAINKQEYELNSPAPIKSFLTICNEMTRMDFHDKRSTNLYFNLISLIYSDRDLFPTRDLITMFGLDPRSLEKSPTIDNDGITSVGSEYKKARTNC